MVRCIEINHKRYPIYHSSGAYHFIVKPDGSLGRIYKLAVEEGRDIIIVDLKKPFSDLGKKQAKAEAETNAERKEKFYPMNECSDWI